MEKTRIILLTIDKLMFKDHKNQNKRIKKGDEKYLITFKNYSYKNTNETFQKNIFHFLIFNVLHCKIIISTF